MQVKEGKYVYCTNSRIKRMLQICSIFLTTLRLYLSSNLFSHLVREIPPHHYLQATYRLLKSFLVFCICTRKTEDIIILWIMRSHRDFQYVWFLCVISASMMPLWFCHLIAQGKWRRCVRFFHYTHYRYLIPSSFSFKLTNKNTKDITVAS